MAARTINVSILKYYTYSLNIRILDESMPEETVRLIAAIHIMRCMDDTVICDTPVDCEVQNGKLKIEPSCLVTEYYTRQGNKIDNYLDEKLYASYVVTPDGEYRIVRNILGVCEELEQQNFTLYTLNGVVDRPDGPAFIYGDDMKSWLRNNVFHREGGPADICNGDETWYVNGVDVDAESEEE